MKTKMRISLLLLTLAALSACDSALVEEPNSFVGPENFYENAADARAALAGAYSQLMQGSFGGYIGSYQFMRMIAKPTPEATVGTNTPEYAFDEWTWTPGNAERGVLITMYQEAYDGINAANAVIDNVPGIEGMDPQLKARFVAEARFLRAMHYYYLIGLFGGVPLVTQETTSLSGLDKPRAPEDSVYAFLIEDVRAVIEDLPPASATEYGRASKGAARALLARIHLQRGSLSAANGITGERQIAQPNDFQQAADLAQEVIDAGQYSLPGNVVEQFRDLFWEDQSGGNNPEIIFAVPIDPGVGITQSQRIAFPCLTVSELAGQPLAGDSWNQFKSSLPFYLSYDDADLRRQVTFLTEFPSETGETLTYDVGNIEGDGVPEESPPFAKYANAVDGTDCEEDNDWVFFRYADVLLMKAEALNEVHQGPTGEVYAAINQVRERAGLEPLSGLSYEAFREAVYTERRKELVAEGDGWFTIQRFFDIATRRIQKHAEFEALQPPGLFGPRIEHLAIDDPQDRLFPIPLDVLNRNPELTQNPGY